MLLENPLQAHETDEEDGWVDRHGGGGGGEGDPEDADVLNLK